jgi:hypothetical protein
MRGSSLIYRYSSEVELLTKCLKAERNSQFSRLPIGFLFTYFDVSETCEDSLLRPIKLHRSQPIILPLPDELVETFASVSQILLQSKSHTGSLIISNSETEVDYVSI